MSDLISRQEAIDALAEQMPKLLSADGTHPADQGILMAQEIYADCIETIEILPSAQPEDINTDACASCPASKVFFSDEDLSDVEILSDLRSQYNCFDEYEEPVYHALSEAIKALSERKTGKWEKYEGRFDFNYECSECSCSSFDKTDYCPQCGAKMEVEQDEKFV